MPEIIVKESKSNPTQYPEQDKAIALGNKKWEKIRDDVGPGRTFESEGDKRDYLRRVASNPANVPGIPPFLPAEQIQVMMNDIHPARECPNDHGCATARDAYLCPRCGCYVEEQ